MLAASWRRVGRGSGSLGVAQVRADDLGEQGMPAIEELPGGEGVEGEEEADSPAEPVAGSLPVFANLIVGIVEGDEVEGQQHIGPAVLVVSEVVLDMVALVLEPVAGLVLDLPAGASAPHQFLNVIGVGLQRGEEAEVGDGSRSAVAVALVGMVRPGGGGGGGYGDGPGRAFLPVEVVEPGRVKWPCIKGSGYSGDDPWPSDQVCHDT